MRIISALFLAIIPSLAWSQTVLTNGQIQFMELSFNNSGPTPSWDNVISDETTITSYTSSVLSTNLRGFDVPGGARFRVQGAQHLFTRPATPDWNFTGVSALQPFRATPQNGDTNFQLVMGISSINVSATLFQLNQFTVSMSALGTNPGQFALYGNDNTFGSAIGSLSPSPILLSTNNNITSFIYTGGTQNFYNLSFSVPGIYDIDFQFSGQRTIASGGGTFTSPFYRYRFDIAAVPEPATWALIGFSVLCILITCWQLRRLHRQRFDAVLSNEN
jgi:hypothetical protein